MSRLVRYRKGGPAATRTPFFQILSLSGGGYRGLFTAIVLEELEAKAGKPLRECFDLVAGTSIGGILACGIAAGIPAAAMRQAFERHGPAVFSSHLAVLGRKLFPVPRFGLLSARYARKGLEEAIDEVLGDRAKLTLGSIATPLLVPAVSATSGTTVLFESGPLSGSRASVTLRDVALATSAAPSYFPEYEIERDSLVDGGIVANAPDAIAAMKAISAKGQRPEEIKLLSIGTAGEAVGEVYRPGRASGSLRWMVLRDLFGLTIAAQQELAVDLVAELLGPRFVRIDVRPDRKRGKAIGLDKAKQTATDTLKSLAREALDDADAKCGADLASMLRHVAAR